MTELIDENAKKYLLAYYQQVGNDFAPILYKTKPMTQQVISGEPATEIYYEKENGTIQQWRRLNKHSINNIRVKIQESTGTPIPNTKFSIIQILIRRIA